MRIVDNSFIPVSVPNRIEWKELNNFLADYVHYSESVAELTIAQGLDIPPEGISWAKAVCKYLYKLGKINELYRIEQTDSFKSKLGDLLARHAGQLSVQVRIAGSFDWSPGEFGDRGSCYWGQYAHSKEVLEQCSVEILKVYNEGGDPISRSWSVKVDRGQGRVVCNAYGELKILDHARIWSKLDEKPVQKRVEVCFFGANDGACYVNGGTGWYVGDNEPKPEYDLGEIYSVDWSDDTRQCECCGEYCCEDDMHYIDSVGFVCNYCFESEYSACDQCYEIVPNDEIAEIDGQYVCECCANDSNACERCGHRTFSELGTFVDSDESTIELCESCLESVPGNCCDSCGDMVHESLLETIEHETVCHCCR